MDLWDFIEQLSGSPTAEPPPAPRPTRPLWETTAQIFIVHQQHCLCGAVVEFADCSGRVMIERRRYTDGATHIHELPECTIPQALPRKIWIESHRTAWCPACLTTSDPNQLPLPLELPQ